MAHHHNVSAAVAEHRTHLAIVNGTCLTARLSHDVDALVVDGHASESGYRVLSVVAHDAGAARDRHWQSALVGLKATRHHTVDRRHCAAVLNTLLSFGNLLFLALLVGLGLALHSLALSLGLAGFLFGYSLLLGGALCSNLSLGLCFPLSFGGLLLGGTLCGSLSLGACGSLAFLGSLCLCLGTSLSLAGLAQPALVLQAGLLGGSLASGQLFLAPLLCGSLGSSPALCLLSGTHTGFFHLDGDETLYLGIHGFGVLSLLRYYLLYGLLLLLQRVHHGLLLLLLALKSLAFLLSLVEHVALLPLHLLQLGVLLVHLSLLCLHHLALRLLP